MIKGKNELIRLIDKICLGLKPAFLKDEKNVLQHTNRIQNDLTTFTNGRLYNSEIIINHVPPSQDQIAHLKLIEIVHSINQILSK